MRHPILTALVTGLAACVAIPASADGEHPLGLNKDHPYGVLSSAYETPHVKWAKPWAGGAVDALVMAPMWSQRETVELAQRLSLKVTAWMSETFTQMTAPAASDPAFGFFQPPPAVVDRCLRQCVAKDYDVIIVGKLDWAMLPGEQRLQLLEKVSDGTGLVYVSPPPGNKELEIVFGGTPAPDGRASIAWAVPIKALPAFGDTSPDDFIRTSMFGKGRVVVLNYRDKLPEKWSAAWPCLTPPWAGPPGAYSSGQAYSDEYHKPKGYVAPDDCPEMEFVPYEYYQSLLARAVVWASGKHTETRLAGIVLPPVLDYPASAHAARVTVMSSGSVVLQAAVRSRHDYARLWAIPSQTAGGESRVTLPALPAGEYFLDVWLVGASSVFDWGSTSFTVVADIDVREISLAGRRYDPGDAITGQVRLSRALAAEEVLVAELWDNHDRKIDGKRLHGGGDTVAFSFVVPRPLTIMHTIRARVTRQGGDVCAGRLIFPVRARKRLDNFKEVVWSAAGNLYITHQMLRKLSRHDQSDAIDVGFSGATHARNIAAADLAAMPYTTGFGHFGTQVAPVRSGKRAMHGCMSNPATLEAVDEWFAMQSDIYGPYGPLAWSHGDESHYANNLDACWSDTCLSAFRKDLGKAYPDLAALNREWNTACADWSEVKPVTYEEAKETGNYAPWVEHRLSAGRVWARLYGRTCQALSKNDPGARGGFDGPQGLALPNGGINWWVLKDHVGLLHDYIYNSESMEIFRSFATPEHVSGMWYGSYGLTWQIGPNTVAFHHFFPWYSLFHGLNSTWFWTMGTPGPLSGYAPDLTSLPFFDASRQSLKEIRSGVFTLFRTGHRANDGIAVHYSEASRVADSLFSEDRRCKGWMEALADVNHALEDNGLQYEYVAYEEIEGGELHKGGYRVLILPHSRAVSEAEAGAIRQFVREGGLAIADIMPGVLNGHGSKQEQSMLADLFPSREPGTISAIGKGKTVLLGDKLAGYGYASYRNMRGWKKLEARWRILGELLEEHAGVTPKVRIMHHGEGEMPPTEIVRFGQGKAELVGLLRKYYLYDNQPYPVTVQFPEKRHVYDVRAGKYVGFRESLTTELSYEARVYARLPYRVKSITLDVPASADGRTPTVVRIALRKSRYGPPGAHVFDVRVFSPGGEELPWYGRRIAASAAEAEAAIPWALNDAAGRYTVVVRDVATGVTAQREVSLP